MTGSADAPICNDVHRINNNPNMSDQPFDFELHRAKAEDSYRLVRTTYVRFAETVSDILREVISSLSMKVVAVESRAKSVESFREKAGRLQDDNPLVPRYEQPLLQIEDLAAARIITFFLTDVEVIDRRIRDEFDVIERSDRSEQLLEASLVGYRSVHYVVQLRHNRTTLPEYRVYRDLKVEIQLRTVLQHAWAEIEHDIQYKSTEDVPPKIQQRFANLAGLLAIADREFQSVHDEEERIRTDTQVSIDQGKLETISITAESLKAYADKKLGEDRRMTLSGYEWEARYIRNIGFSNLEQLERAIGDYDHDQVSRTIHGSRMGQLSRLGDMVMLSVGDRFVSDHPFSRYEWWRTSKETSLSRARAAGLRVG